MDQYLRLGYYTLAPDGVTPLKCPDVRWWGVWMEKGVMYRLVDRTWISDDVEVSTVFLGLDHNYSQEGEPILWETMIFGGINQTYQVRYVSYADARIGHERAIEVAREGLRWNRRAGFLCEQFLQRVSGGLRRWKRSLTRASVRLSQIQWRVAASGSVFGARKSRFIRRTKQR